MINPEDRAIRRMKEKIVILAQSERVFGENNHRIGVLRALEGFNERRKRPAKPSTTQSLELWPAH